MAVQGPHPVVTGEVGLWKAVDGAFQSVGLNNACDLLLISLRLINVEFMVRGI